MIEAVIFDVDGTLVDSVDLHARAWVEAFREYMTTLVMVEAKILDALFDEMTRKGAIITDR